jgi:hypothetical protein
MQQTLREINGKLDELATARQIEQAVGAAVEQAFSKRISPRRDKVSVHNVGSVAPERDAYLGSEIKQHGRIDPGP